MSRTGFGLAGVSIDGIFDGDRIVISGGCELDDHGEFLPRGKGHRTRQFNRVIPRQSDCAAGRGGQCAADGAAGRIGVDLNRIRSAVGQSVGGHRRQLAVCAGRKNVGRPSGRRSVAFRAHQTKRVILILRGEIRGARIVIKYVGFLHGKLHIVIRNPEKPLIAKLRSPTVLDQKSTIARRRGGELAGWVIIIPPHQRNGMINWAFSRFAIRSCANACAVVIVSVIVRIPIRIDPSQFIGAYGCVHSAVVHDGGLQITVVRRIGASGNKVNTLNMQLRRQVGGRRKGTVVCAGAGSRVRIGRCIDGTGPARQIGGAHLPVSTLARTDVEATQIVEVVLREMPNIFGKQNRFHGAIRGEGPAISTEELVFDWTDLAVIPKVIAGRKACCGLRGQARLANQVGHVHRGRSIAESVALRGGPHQRSTAKKLILN